MNLDNTDTITETNTFNVNKIRAEFPVLHQEVHGKKLHYFDNAATTHKPKVVIEALTDYYGKKNANIHRGIHYLAEIATAEFENTRQSMSAFINSPSEKQIIFTKGTTDSINLIASGLSQIHFKEGDEIILSMLEHHSNIVPWQLAAERTGAKIKVIPIHEDGSLNMEEYKKLLGPKTKLVAVNHASNSLGTINDIEKITKWAHEAGALVAIDGAQASSHFDIDVQAIDCDFYSFSVHKMFGPTGVGILYGKEELLNSLPPYQGGGEMISEVTFEKTTYNEIPYKFEAGTPNIADVVATRMAIEFINEITKKEIRKHEDSLLQHATEKLGAIKGLKIIGQAENKMAVVSFLLENIHPFDAGFSLDAKGIAVRTGHHCTQPLMKHLDIEGTIRASFSIYNTIEEIDYLAESIENLIKKTSR